jgi:hypothetical protein
MYRVTRLRKPLRKEINMGGEIVNPSEDIEHGKNTYSLRRVA